MLNKKMITTGFWIFNSRILGAFFQFGFQLLIAREFGVAGYGIFSLAFSVTVVASVIARWGADQWVLRELARCFGPISQRNWFAVFTNGLLFVSSSSFVIAIILIAGSYSSFLQLDQTQAHIMRLMFIAVVPFSILNYISEAFRAIDRQLVASAVQGVLIPFFSIIFFVSSAWLFQAQSLALVGVVYLLASTLVLLIGMSLWHATSKGLGPREFIWLGKSFFIESTPIAWISIITTLLSFTDILVIGSFHSSSEVGLYAAAQRLVLLISFIILSLNNIVGPKFASLYGEKNYRMLFDLYSSSTKLLIILMMPVAVLVAIFSTSLLSWFGEEFTGANEILWLLLAGQVINIATGPVGVLMMMTSHTVQLKQITLGAFAIHLFLTILLTPKFGALGAASAAFISGTTLNLVCWGYVNNMRKQYSYE